MFHLRIFYSNYVFIDNNSVKHIKTNKVTSLTSSHFLSLFRFVSSLFAFPFRFGRPLLLGEERRDC